MTAVTYSIGMFEDRDVFLIVSLLTTYQMSQHREVSEVSQHRGVRQKDNCSGPAEGARRATGVGPEQREAIAAGSLAHREVRRPDRTRGVAFGHQSWTRHIRESPQPAGRMIPQKDPIVGCCE